MNISACAESQKPGGTAWRAGKWLLAILGIAVLGLSIHVHFLAAYYGDKQWQMLYAHMWVSGKQLYADIFPVSPPLIFWIYGIPAALSRLPGLPDEFPLLIMLGLALIACCIFLCMRLIRLHPGFMPGGLRMQFLALLCFVFIVRTSSIYFLDREHLFMVMIFPYLLRFSPSLTHAALPRWLNVAIGILAGIGFCIKPYCLVVWAGIQLLYGLECRSWRILISLENILIYGIGLVYLLSVWLLYPDYFAVVLPIALLTYSATRDTHSVFDYASNAVATLFVTFLMFRLRHASPYRRDIYYLAALCPVFLAYALLNNNWAYTYYPVSSIALVVTGFVFWEFLYLRKEQETLGKRAWLLTAGMACCLLTLAARLAISLNYFSLVMADTCHNNVECQWDDRMVAELAGETPPLSFGSISIDFARWTRLSHYTGALWQTRFPQLWMLPKFLISGPAFMQRHHIILDYVAESFADDLNRNKPGVVFADDTDLFYTAVIRLDLVKFFNANPKFKDAFAHYRFAHMLDLCDAPGIVHTPQHDLRCRYYVYRRID